MNTTIQKISGILFLFSLIFFMSCVKEKFDTPPVNIPKVDFPSNTTIAELKALYVNDIDSIADDIIIQGIITANDESGNIYKSLFIRDNTAGIEVKLDKSGLYNEFKLGQRVFIKCKGMYMGKYGGMQQLGYKYNNAIGRLPDILISEHLFRDSLPGPAPQPILITMPGITSEHYGQLVKFENVSFETPGVSFAETSATTNRNLKDADGNIILVRTSNYADFATNLLPQGAGTVVGILSIYNNDKQLYIRNLNDLIGFDSSAVFPQNIFADNFDAAPTSNWTTFSVASNKNWGYNSTDKCMEMNGYGADVASEDWMISAQISLIGVSQPTLQFKSWTKYTDTGFPFPMKVYISTDYTGSGSPVTATWTELTATLPAAHSQAWTSSGAVDLTSYIGQKVYIGFKYVSSGVASNSSSDWKVDEVSVKALL